MPRQRSIGRCVNVGLPWPPRTRLCEVGRDARAAWEGIGRSRSAACRTIDRALFQREATAGLDTLPGKVGRNGDTALQKRPRIRSPGGYPVGLNGAGADVQAANGKALPREPTNLERVPPVPREISDGAWLAGQVIDAKWLGR